MYFKSSSKLISLSTDKASSPVNLYGASKLLADKIAVGGDFIKGNQNSFPQ